MNYTVLSWCWWIATWICHWIMWWATKYINCVGRAHWNNVKYVCTPHFGNNSNKLPLTLVKKMRVGHVLRWFRWFFLYFLTFHSFSFIFILSLTFCLVPFSKCNHEKCWQTSLDLIPSGCNVCLNKTKNITLPQNMSHSIVKTLRWFLWLIEVLNSNHQLKETHESELLQLHHEHQVEVEALRHQLESNEDDSIIDLATRVRARLDANDEMDRRILERLSSSNQSQLANGHVPPGANGEASGKLQVIIDCISFLYFEHSNRIWKWLFKLVWYSSWNNFENNAIVNDNTC